MKTKEVRKVSRKRSSFFFPSLFTGRELLGYLGRRRAKLVKQQHACVNGLGQDSKHASATV